VSAWVVLAAAAVSVMAVAGLCVGGVLALALSPETPSPAGHQGFLSECVWWAAPTERIGCLATSRMPRPGRKEFDEAKAGTGLRLVGGHRGEVLALSAKLGFASDEER
jgi:hypothetical protein